MTWKFRAWDNEINHMYYPPNSHVSLDCSGLCINLQTRKWLNPLFYIGLNDRNGKEIWDGDLLLTPKLFVSNSAYLLEVRFGSGCYFGYNLENEDEEDIRESQQLEVVGNLYETPELVEAYKK